MLKKLILISVIILTACSDPPEKSKVNQLIAQINKAHKATKKHVDFLEAQENLNGELAKLYEQKGEQLTEQFNTAIEFCEGKDTAMCNELRESMLSFKKAVSEHAKKTHEAAEAYLNNKEECSNR